MLNNPTPTNGLHARQKQHRRQISTPNAFDGVKVPTMQPAPRQRISKAHRRGQSLDIRQQQQRGMCLNSTVSTGTNNTGSATYPQHFDLREAQQQSTQARPGNAEGLYTPLTPNNPCEAMFMSPMSTPQMSAFDVNLNQAFANWPSSARSSIGSELDLDWNPQSSAQSTPTFSNFPDASQTPGWASEAAADMSRMSSRRSMGSQVLSRVQKFELMSAQGQQRPITPPEQNMTFDLLPTPEETPEDRMDKPDSRPARFAEGYDESMEETLKPVRGRAPTSIQSFFADAQQVAQQQPQTSLSRSTTQSSLAESEVDGDDSFEQFVKYDAVPQASDPSTPHAQMVHENMDAPIAWKQESESPQSAKSAHRRKPSRASIVSAQSIEGVNLEESLQDTGVTMEEIDQFICGGPGAADDGKYICTFEECGKTFGRKENIKSHVQTHLNDRRYLCEHCKKCFVRLHDLKRHAKIHTGIKPYECRCGRTFARHDALTRHRQRGMCVGSFEGAVRASAKRGRPKKARPDMEERQEKATKTRRKNNMSISSVSSMSSAYSSAPSSPATTPREADWTPAATNFANSARTIRSSTHMPMQSKSPMKSRSPMGIKTESCVSPQELIDGLSQPNSPSNGQASRHATPPGLSQTPSPEAIQPLNLGLPSNAMINTTLDNLSPESFESSSVFDGSSPQNMSDDQFSSMLYSFGERDVGFMPMDSTQNLLLPQKAGDDFSMFDEDQFFAM